MSESTPGNTMPDPQNAGLVRIEVRPHGPLRVEGKFLIVHEDGTEEVREGRFSLCRCGASGKKPICDGAHKTSGF